MRRPRKGIKQISCHRLLEIVTMPADAGHDRFSAIICNPACISNQPVEKANATSNMLITLPGPSCTRYTGPLVLCTRGSLIRRRLKLLAP